jgi:hypothetical protein
MFARLFDEAETARWRLADIPWRDLKREAVTPQLVELVREIVASEATTFSATQQFLRDFANDIDLTNWISVWFYEETKHPQVMMRWLDAVGASYDDEAVRRARVTAPFMKSKTATLTSNVISEMLAATRYMNLREHSPEPVLSWIAARLAGDEARHAASFFRFARAKLASMPGDVARRERARGVEVLQAWLGGARPATHPVAQMIERLAEGPEHGAIDLGFTAIRNRVIRVVGLLLDLPLQRQEDVSAVLLDLLGGKKS